jgi:hypothetical protein
LQVEHKSDANEFEIPIKVMWKDGSDNELASDMITLMVKGTDSDSQCKDATLAWESTTRDLTMYHNTDGNNEQSAEGGLHFWAE